MTMNVQLTVLIGVLYCLAAEALECKTCMQYGGTTEDEATRAVLEAMEQAGDVNCKNNAGDDSVPSVVCPDEDIEMMKPVCMTTAISAKYTIPDTDMSFNMDMTMRGCHIVLTSVEPSCDPIEKYKDELMQAMGEVAGDIADLSGVMCFCEGDNCNTDEAKADRFTGEGDYPDGDSTTPSTDEGDYPDDGSGNGTGRYVHSLALILAGLTLYMLIQ